MTILDRDPQVRGVEGPRCRWCRVVLPERRGPGRPRSFCGQACRQWDWVARQRARELALADGELVIARDQLDRWHDDLYVLDCAVADTRRDLEAGLSADEVLPALEWLLEAAGSLVDRRIANPADRR